MTVKELKAKLGGFDDELDVFITVESRVSSMTGRIQIEDALGDAFLVSTNSPCLPKHVMLINQGFDDEA